TMLRLHCMMDVLGLLNCQRWYGCSTFKHLVDGALRVFLIYYNYWEKCCQKTMSFLLQCMKLKRIYLFWEWTMKRYTHALMIIYCIRKNTKTEMIILTVECQDGSAAKNFQNPIRAFL